MWSFSSMCPRNFCSPCARAGGCPVLPAAEDALALSSGSEEELERRAEKQICLLLSKGEKDNKTARKKRGFISFGWNFTRGWLCFSPTDCAATSCFNPFSPPFHVLLCRGGDALGHLDLLLPHHCFPPRGQREAVDPVCALQKGPDAS